MRKRNRERSGREGAPGLTEELGPGNESWAPPAAATLLRRGMGAARCDSVCVGHSRPAQPTPASTLWPFRTLAPLRHLPFPYCPTTPPLCASLHRGSRRMLSPHSGAKPGAPQGNG